MTPFSFAVLASPSGERMMNPMLLEARLMFQRQDIEGDTSTPSCVVNHHLSTEESHFSVLLLSEAEQLVRLEFIKDLSDFKQFAVSPLPPQTHQLNSLMKESSVQSPVDTQSSNHYRRSKIKYRKPVVKVVCDMFKKWVEGEEGGTGCHRYFLPPPAAIMSQT
jgi:hypothetical protein